jgi:hypothetical protein
MVFSSGEFRRDEFINDLKASEVMRSLDENWVGVLFSKGNKLRESNWFLIDSYSNDHKNYMTVL